MVIVHSDLALDIAAVGAFGREAAGSAGAAGTEADSARTSAVPSLLRLLWKMAASHSMEPRWLVALDACVWIAVRPGSGCSDASLQAWLCGPSGVAAAVLRKAKKDKAKAVSLRDMVAGWGAENPALAADSVFQTASPKAPPEALAVEGADGRWGIAAPVTPNLDTVRFVVSLEDDAGSWWDSADAYTTLGALVRVSAVMGRLSTVTTDIGSTLTVGDPRTTFIRSVVAAVLWSFGTELLQRIGADATAALRKSRAPTVEAESPGTGAEVQPSLVDAQAVALLEAVIGALSGWLGGGSSDTGAAALISEAATTVATFDTAIASPRRARAAERAAASGSGAATVAAAADEDTSSGEESAALARMSYQASPSGAVPVSVGQGSSEGSVGDALPEPPRGFVFVEEALLLSLQCCASRKAELEWAAADGPHLTALRRSVAPGGEARSIVVEFLLHQLSWRSSRRPEPAKEPQAVGAAQPGGASIVAGEGRKTVLAEDVEHALQEVFNRCALDAEGRASMAELAGICRSSAEVAECFRAPHDAAPQESEHDILEGVFHGIDTENDHRMGWEDFSAACADELGRAHEDGNIALSEPSAHSEVLEASLLLLPPRQLRADLDVLITKNLATTVPEEDADVAGAPQSPSAEAVANLAVDFGEVSSGEGASGTADDIVHVEPVVGEEFAEVEEYDDELHAEEYIAEVFEDGPGYSTIQVHEEEEDEMLDSEEQAIIDQHVALEGEEDERHAHEGLDQGTGDRGDASSNFWYQGGGQEQGSGDSGMLSRSHVQASQAEVNELAERPMAREDADPDDSANMAHAGNMLGISGQKRERSARVENVGVQQISGNMTVSSVAQSAGDESQDLLPQLGSYPRSQSLSAHPQVGQASLSALSASNAGGLEYPSAREIFKTAIGGPKRADGVENASKANFDHTLTSELSPGEMEVASQSFGLSMGEIPNLETTLKPSVGEVAQARNPVGHSMNCSVGEVLGNSWSVNDAPSFCNMEQSVVPERGPLQTVAETEMEQQTTSAEVTLETGKGDVHAPHAIVEEPKSGAGPLPPPSCDVQQGRSKVQVDAAQWVFETPTTQTEDLPLHTPPTTVPGGEWPYEAMHHEAMHHEAMFGRLGAGNGTGFGYHIPPWPLEGVGSSASSAVDTPVLGLSPPGLSHFPKQRLPAGSHQGLHLLGDIGALRNQVDNLRASMERGVQDGNVIFQPRYDFQPGARSVNPYCNGVVGIPHQAVFSDHMHQVPTMHGPQLGNMVPAAPVMMHGGQGGTAAHRVIVGEQGVVANAGIYSSPVQATAAFSPALVQQASGATALQPLAPHVILGQQTLLAETGPAFSTPAFGAATMQSPMAAFAPVASQGDPRQLQNTDAVAKKRPAAQVENSCAVAQKPPRGQQASPVPSAPNSVDLQGKEELIQEGIKAQLRELAEEKEKIIEEGIKSQLRELAEEKEKIIEEGIKSQLRELTGGLEDFRRQLHAQQINTAILTSELRANHAPGSGSQRPPPSYLSEMPRLNLASARESLHPMSPQQQPASFKPMHDADVLGIYEPALDKFDADADNFRSWGARPLELRQGRHEIDPGAARPVSARALPPQAMPIGFEASGGWNGRRDSDPLLLPPWGQDLDPVGVASPLSARVSPTQADMAHKNFFESDGLLAQSSDASKPNRNPLHGRKIRPTSEPKTSGARTKHSWNQMARGAVEIPTPSIWAPRSRNESLNKDMRDIDKKLVGLDNMFKSLLR